MAFQKSIQVPEYGITLQEAYIKLASIKVEFGVVEYVLNTYASKEIREGNPSLVIARKTGTAPYELVLAAEGEELFAKTYNFIKSTNTEYSDALDV
jgi:hypothetical protein